MTLINILSSGGGPTLPLVICWIKPADMYPDKEALVDNTSRLTYSQVREKAKEILGTHEVPPLPEDVDREVSKILLAAEKEKRKK